MHGVVEGQLRQRQKVRHHGRDIVHVAYPLFLLPNWLWSRAVPILRRSCTSFYALGRREPCSARVEGLCGSSPRLSCQLRSRSARRRSPTLTGITAVVVL